MDTKNPIAIISLGLRIGTLDRIENDRGEKSRSAFLRDIVETYYEAVDEVV